MAPSSVDQLKVQLVFAPHVRVPERYLIAHGPLFAHTRTLLAKPRETRERDTLMRLLGAGHVRAAVRNVPSLKAAWLASGTRRIQPGRFLNVGLEEGRKVIEYLDSKAEQIETWRLTDTPQSDCIANRLHEWLHSASGVRQQLDRMLGNGLTLLSAHGLGEALRFIDRIEELAAEHRYDGGFCSGDVEELAQATLEFKMRSYDDLRARLAQAPSSDVKTAVVARALSGLKDISGELYSSSTASRMVTHDGEALDVLRKALRVSYISGDELMDLLQSDERKEYLNLARDITLGGQNSGARRRLWNFVQGQYIPRIIRAGSPDSPGKHLTEISGIAAAVVGLYSGLTQDQSPLVAWSGFTAGMLSVAGARFGDFGKEHAIRAAVRAYMTREVH
ncbi:MAG TPA: hypothetical protein VE621_11705 [Bryobacteraceae bacterium]|nr:hypothetical protein [Bryobacteraceae bacterium]